MIRSYKPRKPTDLLHRALAHFNHGTFEIDRLTDRLTVFETPATAILDLSSLQSPQKKHSLIGQILRCFFTRQRPDLSVSVKVTANDCSRHRFGLTYSWKNSTPLTMIGLYNLPPHPDKVEHLIKDMFGSINDVLLES
jgi:hypothetical protein